jgi:hypothetical protein
MTEPTNDQVFQDAQTVTRILWEELIDYLHDTKLEWGRDNPFDFEADCEMLDELTEALERLAIHFEIGARKIS